MRAALGFGEIYGMVGGFHGFRRLEELRGGEPDRPLSLHPDEARDKGYLPGYLREVLDRLQDRDMMKLH